MLPAALVLEVRRLIDDDELSYRAIAKRLGVSFGTVSNIANGRRGIYAYESADGKPDGIPVRCRGCGGRVYEPCLLCRARAVRGRAESIRRLVRQSMSSRPRPRHVA